MINHIFNSPKKAKCLTFPSGTQWVGGFKVTHFCSWNYSRKICRLQVEASEEWAKLSKSSIQNETTVLGKTSSQVTYGLIFPKLLRRSSREK